MSTEYSTNLTGTRPHVHPVVAVPQMRLDVFRILRLRKRLMLVVFLVLAIPGVVFAYVLTPVEYQATATLQFPAKAPKILYDDSPRQLSASYEKYVSTQVHLYFQQDRLAFFLRNAGTRGT